MEHSHQIVKRVSPRQNYKYETNVFISHNYNFKNRIINIVLLVLYYFALCAMYINYIQPVWESIGLKLSIDESRILPSIIILLITSFLLPPFFKKASDLLVCSILIFTLIPTLVMFVYGGISQSLFFSTIAFYVFTLFFNKLSIRNIKLSKFKIDRIFYYLIAINVITLTYVVIRTGISSFDLDFSDVYTRRDFVTDSFDLAIDGYIAQLCIQINVISATLALYYRKYIYFLIFMIIAVILFGLLGHKSQIVLPFILIFINIFINKKHIINYLVLFIAIFACFIAYYYIYTSDPIDLVASTFRRLMFIPVSLNQAYFDYALSKGYVYWADSKFGLGLVEYQDTVSTANAIGVLITGNIKTHANTGLIGSGYLQAGYVGLAIYFLIFGAITSIIDAIAKVKNINSIAALLCVPPLITGVMSSDLPSLIFSGGLGGSIIIIYILPSEAISHDI